MFISMSHNHDGFYCRTQGELMKIFISSVQKEFVVERKARSIIWRRGYGTGQCGPKSNGQSDRSKSLFETFRAQVFNRHERKVE